MTLMYIMHVPQISVGHHSDISELLFEQIVIQGICIRYMSHLYENRHSHQLRMQGSLSYQLQWPQVKFFRT
jgi:hypothetical protein